MAKSLLWILHFLAISVVLSSLSIMVRCGLLVVKKVEERHNAVRLLCIHKLRISGGVKLERVVSIILWL